MLPRRVRQAPEPLASWAGVHMPSVLIYALDLLRAAGAWALGTSATTAAVSAFARALCLPPYWPPEFVLRCRPEGHLPALLRALPDTALTAALLFVPALALGCGIHLVVRLMQRRVSPSIVRILAALAGAGLWAALVTRLERSYLDFIISGYAIAAGALVGAIIADRAIARRHPGVLPRRG